MVSRIVIAWTIWMESSGQVLFEDACMNGVTIPNSDRNTTSPCQGSIGDECEYQCDPGYLGIGRHVCQSYSTMGKVVIDSAFFGGRCEKLCSQVTCSNGTVPVRVNSSDANKIPCFETTCLLPEEALRRLARGNYEVWRNGRNDHTGIYIDHVDPALSKQSLDFTYASLDATGPGVAMECVAHALGFISLQEAQERVLLTFQALANRLPAFRLERNPRGWVPTFIDSNTGGTKSPNVYSTDSTAFNGVGVLFAKTYFEHVDPSSKLTMELSDLGHELYSAVRWDSLLCDQGVVDGKGTTIPWILDNASGCSDLFGPAPDGFFYFSEMHWTTWLAYHQACAGQPENQCSNQAIEGMWNAWQGRRNSPNFAYAGRSLLTLWPSYVLQLPYYLVHPFNSDLAYLKLFRNQWEAEWAYANSSAYYAGDGGRYGLGAGPTAQWCSGTTYKADLISSAADDQTCRMYSPYAVAGYLPVAQQEIRSHILDLLASGEAVLPVNGTPYYVLWRKSLLDPSWSLGYGITLVDFAGELFGLSTLWLGAQFFADHTNHWPAEIFV